MPLESLEHNCGVVLVVGKEETFNVVPIALELMQASTNRGNRQCGISVQTYASRLATQHAMGTPNKGLMHTSKVLTGPRAVGHVRYVTNKHGKLEDAHPAVVHWGKKRQTTMGVAFNGNLLGFEAKRKELQKQGYSVRNTDTAVQAALLAHQLQTQRSVEAACRATCKDISGAHNVAALTNEGLAIAWMNRKGVQHPLHLFETRNEWVVISETAAARRVLGGSGKHTEFDPGDAWIFERGKKPYKRQVEDSGNPHFCPFEFMYFGHHESVWRDIAAREARIRSGEHVAAMDEASGLFDRIERNETRVAFIPNSGREYANAYAMAIQRGCAVPVILRNPDFDPEKRTFLDGGLESEILAKYLFDAELARGKHLILWDDSIVRGRTLENLLPIIRKICKPKSIHLRIGFPVVQAPCFYGINMSTMEELWFTKYFLMLNAGTSVANVEKKMAKDLKVDSIEFLPVEALPNILASEKIGPGQLCLGCTQGMHPTIEGQHLYQIQISDLLQDKH